MRILSQVALSLFVLVLAVAPALANDQAAPLTVSDKVLSDAVTSAQRYIGTGVALAARESLQARSVTYDGAGVTHVRFDSHYQGVRVFGGEVIAHVRASSKRVVGLTNRHLHIVASDSRPAILADDAAGIAMWDMALTSLPREAPETELVYYPVAGAGYRLAWMVDTFAEGTDFPEPMARIHVIDALNGDVLDSWDNLQTAYTPGTGTAKIGTAKTLYLAQVSINTEQYTDLKYGMVDKLAGSSYTTDMLNKRTGSGTLFTDADNVWGNFYNTDRATAGTDAHLGMTYTFNYFKNVHGRNGIYNDGKGVYSRVHYSRSYNNAFWSASCKCMTYGDGDGTTFTPLVSLDVAAHEMSHGVCSATANLVYSGESGGLNESNSDIFATCVEFWTQNAKDVGDWMIGEMIYTPNTAGDALRYMDDPKKDGRSIDNYSLYTSSIDVHYSSGIANNFFYLLSQGGTNRTSGITVATGVGINKAERIWYVALTGYMTTGTTFAQARTATLNAATQLYGSGSTEYNTVAAAWTAVGVN